MYITFVFRNLIHKTRCKGNKKAYILLPDVNKYKTPKNINN